jgi:hypothetical protein
MFRQAAAFLHRAAARAGPVCRRRALVGPHAPRAPGARPDRHPSAAFAKRDRPRSRVGVGGNGCDDADDALAAAASLAAAVAHGSATILVPSARGVPGGFPGDVFAARASAFLALRWLSRKAFARRGRKGRGHLPFVKGLVAHAVLVSWSRRQGHAELKELGDYMCSVLAFRNGARRQLTQLAAKAWQQRERHRGAGHDLQQRKALVARAHSVAQRQGVAVGLAAIAQACVPGVRAARAGLKLAFDRFKHTVDLPLDAAWLRQVAGQRSLTHALTRRAAFAWLAADDRDATLTTSGLLQGRSSSSHFPTWLTRLTSASLF